MYKSVSCRDAGVDCDFTICAKTEDELFRKAAEHGRKEHNMKEIPNDLKEKVRSLIRDVERC